MRQTPAKKFYKNSDSLIYDLKRKPASYWLKRGEKNALKLFHSMATRVPAYKDFLKKNRLSPDSIKGMADFKRVPVTDKHNYLLSYELKDLCWDGSFSDRNWMISSTSGSTGEPFYFPRTSSQDDQFTLTAEACLKDFFKVHKKTTLFIDCFALGVWIGGIFMYQAIRKLVDAKKYPISLITPGADKAEAIKAIENLGSQFDQIIIGGYGPLVKDLIDEGVARGLDFKKRNIKYFFAAEAFTENFRDYIAKHGGSSNIYTDLINHYGTADLGTMANETPVSILVRRMSLENQKLFRELFKRASHIPTLAQYIPELFFFEEVAGRLLCSGMGGFPLVRYDLKDRGGILTMEDMEKKFEAHHLDLPKEIKNHKLDGLQWNLPFVYLYERADFVVGIYSVNIYPQTIRKALEDKKNQNYITGKFHMSADFDKNQNQFFKIDIELKPGKKLSLSLKKSVLFSIISCLEKENSEWRDFYADVKIRQKIIPKLKFYSYQDSRYFNSKIKQRWVKNHG